MSKPTLGIYQFIRNGTKYDYPFIESLESAIPIADKIMICECESEDDTLVRLEEFQAKYPDKVEIIHREWIKHYLELSGIANYAATFLKTDWKWQLQSDEVLHEKDYDLIRDTLQNASPSTTAIRVHYHHMLANFETEFNFCYENIIRIARRNSGWSLMGDACELGLGDHNNVVDSKIEVFHYGKVHNGEVGWTKEWDFQHLFTDIGFPDPKMKEMEEKLGQKFCDYVYLFESNIKDKKVWRFEGTHPAIMTERIARFKGGGWEQFESRIKEGLKLL